MPAQAPSPIVTVIRLGVAWSDDGPNPCAHERLGKVKWRALLGDGTLGCVP